MTENKIQAGSKVRITRGFRKGQETTVATVIPSQTGGHTLYVLNGTGTSGFYKASSLKLV